MKKNEIQKYSKIGDCGSSLNSMILYGIEKTKLQRHMDQLIVSNKFVDTDTKVGNATKHCFKKISKLKKRTVSEFILDDLIQELKQDDQRFEVENVARVVVTPSSVEIYTFDDFMYLVEFNSKMSKQSLAMEIK